VAIVRVPSNLSGPPAEPVATPGIVTELAVGELVRPVWSNALGGITFELGGGADRRFVKWAPAGSGLDLAAERDRLGWAAPFHPVPRVLGFGASEAGTWMLTAGLTGDSAVSARWRADPLRAATAIGAGLRALHDALPVEGCPFDWSAARRAGARIGKLGPVPAVDRLVVCHGDACAPNTLIGSDGEWSGHVDFGALGLADRWADLAVATASTVWNFGAGFEDAVLQSYGIDRDEKRIRFYRALWDLDG
jgi:kanamycin kinase